MDKKKDLFSIPELREWLAARGVHRSREALQRRARGGEFGELVGRQYIVRLEEAEMILQDLERQDKA